MQTIKRRNMLVQFFLMIITCGIYAIYWYYVTASEMASVAGTSDASPGLWTVFLFVPLLNFYSFWKHGELFELTAADRVATWLMFILWIAFPPAVWFLVQTDLNKKALAAGN